MAGQDTAASHLRRSGTPPGLLFIIGYVVAGMLETLAPLLPAPEQALRVIQLAVGSILVAAGGTLYLAAIATLRRAHTAVLPGRDVTQLVTTGPYRFSRNPAYLGLVIVWCGVSAALNWAWPFVLLPIVLVGQQFIVIRAEERHLAEVFGVAFERYCRTVRRWL